MRVKILPKMTQGANVVLSAQIHVEKNIYALPDTLWFSVPKKYEALVESSAELFVTALIHLAMNMKESIEVVEHSVCEKWLHGLDEYQRVFYYYWPEDFSPVSVRAKSRACDPSIRGKYVGAAFSGGVDSFFTLESHLGKFEKFNEFQITHALFVHGFDISIADERNFDAPYSKFETYLNSKGIDLVPVSTNVREFIGFLDWSKVHGSALLSIALLFKNMFRLFYVPSSGTFVNPHPWSSDSKSDHLLSTAQTRIHYDGAHATRSEKIRFLVKHAPEVFSMLRVCWEYPDGFHNCGACEKCVRTLGILKMLNASYLNVTFHRKFSYVRALKPRVGAGSRSSAHFVVKCSIKENRWDIAAVFFLSSVTGYAVYQIQKSKTWLKRALSNLFMGTMERDKAS